MAILSQCATNKINFSYLEHTRFCIHRQVVAIITEKTHQPCFRSMLGSCTYKVLVKDFSLLCAQLQENESQSYYLWPLLICSAIDYRQDICNEFWWSTSNVYYCTNIRGMEHHWLFCFILYKCQTYIPQDLPQSFAWLSLQGHQYFLTVKYIELK